MSKWKIRFYVNVPLHFMADVGADLGTFQTIPMYPFKDGEKGWYFEIFLKGETSEGVLEKCIDEIHEKIDKMSLQIMREILISEIVVFNISDVFEKNEKELVKITDKKILNIDKITTQKFIQQIFQYPYGYSSQRGTWMMNPYQINVRGTIASRITDTAIEKKDSKALKWFVKALGANNEVERFTSYVTSLDILSHKNNLEEREPICRKCKKPISIIHDCGQKLLNQAYAKDHLIEFGISESNADKINKLRNKTFHGRKSLTMKDMEEFLDVNISLVHILVNHFKKIMNIDDFMPPILNAGTIMIDKFCYVRERPINQEIFDEIKPNILELKS
ncbi:MAG: hypothetical protein WD717_08055 [Nitrosarchaeum sp.]